MRILVYMMDNFIRFKKTSNMFFYDKTVFHNIPFSVCVRVVGGKNGPISATASISDSEFEIRVIDPSSVFPLPNPFAFLATKLLISFPRAIAEVPTFRAFVRFMKLSPSVFKTAIYGTVMLVWPSVKRVKLFFAFIANSYFSVVSHKTYFIKHYCESQAVKRLRQEVLSL